MKRKIITIISAASVLTGILFYIIFNSDSDEYQVVFFDVGQGDSILIDGPENFQILIDGGPDNTVIQKLGQYLPFYDRTIELVILTHPDADHVTGLVEVLERYRVKTIMDTEVLATNDAYARLRELIRQKSIEEIIGQQGKELRIPGGGDLKVLYPVENVSGREFKDINSTSLVARFEVGQHSFLFTGDLPKEGEGELISTRQSLKADVLKVGHHGSKYSTSPAFVKAIDPAIAVIQVGEKNHFGHPDKSILELLSDYGSQVVRTDQAGDILIDCGNLRVKTKKSIDSN
ncbi:MAG: ComEC/Rec2 family competence protein [Patescibacteria group bacterium]|nr:ComEC/Rec2 family competence protein [Patescibacteria group bacterium]